MDHHPTTNNSSAANSATHPLRSTARKLIVLWLAAIAGLIATACVTTSDAGEPVSLATPLIQHDMAYTDDDDPAINSQITRLYLAYFGRPPETEGLTFWRNKRKAGTPIVAVADSFAESLEFQNRYGQAEDTEFVSLVFNNVLDETRPTKA